MFEYSYLKFLVAFRCLLANACSLANYLPVQIAFGSGHQLSEVNCFLPFSAHLPFELASAVAQAASAIATQKQMQMGE